MQKPRGYGIIVDPDPPRGRAQVHEFDVAECAHCGSVITIEPHVDVHRCTCCDALICKNCVGKGCDPLEKKLARWEARAKLFQVIDGG